MKSPLLLVFALITARTEAADVVIRCGKLLDVPRGVYLTGALITIRDRNIFSVEPGGGSAPAIDLSGATCLPGLIDVHVHLTSDPRNSGYKSLGISVPRATLIGARNARATLLAGFTTVRNVGAKGYSDVALRDAIEAGDIPGPRMQVSGAPLAITGGHGDSNLLAPEFHSSGQGVADGPWAARAKVRENIKFGADL